MKPTEPLPIHHSWPLFDRERHLGIAGLFSGCEATLSRITAMPGRGDDLASRGIGIWECDLADNRLHWSSGVYDLFGIPRGAAISRDEAVALYCDESRAAMEMLRAYALRHGRGFTLDIEIHPDFTRRQWVRLSAAPVYEGGRITRLHGVKRAL